jgi:hypothetical protein
VGSAQRLSHEQGRRQLVFARRPQRGPGHKMLRCWTDGCLCVPGPRAV